LSALPLPFAPPSPNPKSAIKKPQICPEPCRRPRPPTSPTDSRLRIYPPRPISSRPSAVRYRVSSPLDLGEFQSGTVASFFFRDLGRTVTGKLASIVVSDR
ncbi:unnamed protein product, partial [Musa banksii]